MTSNDVQPLPVYVHINKAGGTSVRQMLQDGLLEDRLLDTLVPRRWGLDNLPRSVHSQDPVVLGEVAELRERQWDLDCFASNLPVGVHELLDRPCEYFSVVREPIDRITSLWSDVYRARRTSQLWQEWAKLNLDISRILASPCGTPLRNDQVRMLTGLQCHEVKASHVVEAMENINRDFSVVGCFEDLPDFAERLQEHYGWKPAPLHHLNIGDRQGWELLSPEDLERLRAANEHDAALYERVRAL